MLARQVSACPLARSSASPHLDAGWCPTLRARRRKRLPPRKTMRAYGPSLSHVLRPLTARLRSSCGGTMRAKTVSLDLPCRRRNPMSASLRRCAPLALSLAAACGGADFTSASSPTDGGNGVDSGMTADAAGGDGGDDGDPGEDGAVMADGGGGTVDGGVTADASPPTLGVFVSGAIGLDTNPGTASLPVKTIAQGMKDAIALGKGAVVVAGSHYPEKVLRMGPSTSGPTSLSEPPGPTSSGAVLASGGPRPARSGSPDRGLDIRSAQPRGTPSSSRYRGDSNRRRGSTEWRSPDAPEDLSASRSCSWRTSLRPTPRRCPRGRARAPRARCDHP